MRYVLRARVVGVEEIKSKAYVAGVGEAAQFNEVSQGWWLVMEGNWSLFLGAERPAFAPGDTVEIKVERVR